ncbi:hypothetical protein D3C86_1582480 [compost metagenome]
MELELRKFIGAVLTSTLIAGCQNIPGLAGLFGGEEDYFPLIEGAKWEYDISIDGMKFGTRTVVASQVTTDEEITTAQISQTDTLKSPSDPTQELSGTTTQTHKKLPDEVQYTTSSGEKKTELKLPFEEGLSFKADGETFFVKTQEDVSTPAGTYKAAWKLVATKNGNTTTKYYANHVGLVKSIRKSSDSIDSVLELTKFTKP